MEDKYTLVIVLIVGLVALELGAMATGNDGAYLLPIASIIAGAVSGLIGYTAGQKRLENAISTLPEPVQTKVREKLYKRKSKIVE